jgi:trans-2,3-dihydro-3-hydroxyanthranilate isomerase
LDLSVRVNFVTVDVFTEKLFGGNPLAVILDAEGLSSEQMQAIAAELNLSETTFVLPPKNPDHTAQVRIFTLRAKLRFAGHPNVSTAFALARSGECYGKEMTGETLIFEELAGLVSIELLKNGNIVSGAKLAAPQPLSTSDEILPQIVAAATSLEEN